MRLIDADELYKYCDVDETREGLYIKSASILTPTFIESLKTIDAMPVVHGHWIKNIDHQGWCCSSCHKDDVYAYTYDCWSDDNYELQDKYCPNCGAKMDK